MWAAQLSIGRSTLSLSTISFDTITLKIDINSKCSATRPTVHHAYTAERQRRARYVEHGRDYSKKGRIQYMGVAGHLGSHRKASPQGLKHASTISVQLPFDPHRHTLSQRNIVLHHHRKLATSHAGVRIIRRRARHASTAPGRTVRTTPMAAVILTCMTAAVRIGYTSTSVTLHQYRILPQQTSPFRPSSAKRDLHGSASSVVTKPPRNTSIHSHILGARQSLCGPSKCPMQKWDWAGSTRQPGFRHSTCTCFSKEEDQIFWWNYMRRCCLSVLDYTPYVAGRGSDPSFAFVLPLP